MRGQVTAGCAALTLFLLAAAPASQQPQNQSLGSSELTGLPASAGDQEAAKLKDGDGRITGVTPRELGRATADRHGNVFFAGPGLDGRPASDIYRTRRTRQGYAPAERLGSAVNTDGREYSPFVSADGSYLVFAREDPALGLDSFFLSFRTDEGHWTEAIYLREFVPTSGHCLSASVTSDGNYLVYVEATVAGRQTGIVEAGFIEDLRQQVFGRRTGVSRVSGCPKGPGAR